LSLSFDGDEVRCMRACGHCAQPSSVGCGAKGLQARCSTALLQVLRKFVVRLYVLLPVLRRTRRTHIHTYTLTYTHIHTPCVPVHVGRLKSFASDALDLIVHRSLRAKGLASETPQSALFLLRDVAIDTLIHFLCYSFYLSVFHFIGRDSRRSSLPPVCGT